MDINAWGWAQWAYVGMTLIGMLIMANKHGKPKTGTENFWTTVLATSTCWIFLYYGRFFK